MKISISIECTTLAEAQSVLGKLSGTSPVVAVTPPPPVDVAELRYLDSVPHISGGIDDQKLRFGKYKGQFTPRELLDADPQYLLWASENLDWSPCTPECEDAARAILGAPPSPRRSAPPPLVAPPTFDDVAGSDDIPF